MHTRQRESRRAAGGRSDALARELGVFGAVMMGLGSILGTGVFVSIGIAAGVAGPAVILAIALAAGVATCNALSSAQLAANHAVSGGTYEYGYRYLHPALGFTAGWMFLCAKTASAATAALGFAGYLLHAIGGETGGAWLPATGIAAVAVLTGVVLSGIRRSSVTNIAIVSVTIGALALFVFAGLPTALDRGTTHLLPFFAPAEGADGPWRDARGLLHATALMFVAYTGYGRIATLGEEVRDPRRTIPRAIVATLVVSGLLYIGVGAVAVGSVGPAVLSAAAESEAAPLQIVAERFGLTGAMGAVVPRLVAVGAITAMPGVLLNLILGLSRVLLAMGRRGDMPGATARLDAAGRTPWVAVLVVGGAIAGLAGLGSVRLAWSFSAFTVLIYYAITNLAALQLGREERLFAPVFPWCGLVACLGLAFWVEWRIWLAGLALIGLGLVGRWLRRRQQQRRSA